MSLPLLGTSRQRSIMQTLQSRANRDCKCCAGHRVFRVMKGILRVEFYEFYQQVSPTSEHQGG